MGNRTRQKNKRGDSKVESNDSPEIPDRGETSDIPGHPSRGGGGWKELRDSNTNDVLGVKRSCIIRSIHQNDEVVITGITSSTSPAPPTVTPADTSS